MRAAEPPLFLVIGWWDPSKYLEVVQSVLASLGLVGKDALHCPPEDVAGHSKVVGTMGRVSVHLFAEKGQILQLISVETARNVGVLTMHDHNLQAQKHLLDCSGCQVAQEMASAIEHKDLPLSQLWQPLGKAKDYIKWKNKAIEPTIFHTKIYKSYNHPHQFI